MDKIYKLAANFNTVDIKIDDEDLIEIIDISSDEFDLDESGEHPIITPELRDELTLRVLQREYDIIAAIKTVAPVAPVKSASHTAAPKAEKAAKKPSENQIAYARSLGMKDPENSTSKEVWTYIQTHR